MDAIWVQFGAKIAMPGHHRGIKDSQLHYNTAGSVKARPHFSIFPSAHIHVLPQNARCCTQLDQWHTLVPSPAPDQCSAHDAAALLLEYCSGILARVESSNTTPPQTSFESSDRPMLRC
jgi:hypothetical protein